MITVKVDGKTIKIMSEIEARDAENAVDARDLKEPICGSNMERAVADDIRDYTKVHAHATEIANALANNDSVTVFCKKGQHRSVTSVFMYLTEHGGKNESEAKQILDAATKTDQHIIRWDQVERSLGYIKALPSRKNYKSGQSTTTVSNTNANVTNNNNNNVSPGVTGSSSNSSSSSSSSSSEDTPSGNSSRKVRESEVKEITEQKDRWIAKGNKSNAFWPTGQGNG
jgi:hypothetical protein